MLLKVSPLVCQGQPVCWDDSYVKIVWLIVQDLTCSCEPVTVRFTKELTMVIKL